MFEKSKAMIAWTVPLVGHAPMAPRQPREPVSVTSLAASFAYTDSLLSLGAWAHTVQINVYLILNFLEYKYILFYTCILNFYYVYVYY